MPDPALPDTSTIYTPRTIFEDREVDFLAPAAARSRDAHRRHPETESDVRTKFQRDRDRIVHSKSFRRLKHKTQVFIAPEGDHYRTRLTHSLEVTQIARTIARALALNEDLVEAIGVGHDLGHTPFGHAGETALAHYLPGFRHNEQSLRVVDVLEKNGEGLNLTDAVRDGILSHSKPDDELSGAHTSRSRTLEGEIIRLSDAIAYMNHDLDDAIRAGLIRPESIPGDVIEVLGDGHSSRIDYLVNDVIHHSNVLDIPGMIQMSPAALEAGNRMRQFLFDHVYVPLNQTENTQKAQRVVMMLCESYEANVELMPGEYADRVETDGKERAVADYVASMTDRFAVEQFEHIYVPRYWSR